MRPAEVHAAPPGIGDLRITLVAALAWRAMAEIVRRRHVDYRFDLLQVHPGGSVAGLIQLHLQARDGSPAARLDFNLGGPRPGGWESADGTRGHLLDLLGHCPLDAIDAMERAAGLSAWPGHRLPPSSPGVRAMRRIASELERRVFEPRPWRTTAGLVGWSEDIVCDWHRHFLAPVRRDADGVISAGDIQRLSRLVLVHEAPAGECATLQSALQGEGLVVDLATGRVARMTAQHVQSGPGNSPP